MKIKNSAKIALLKQNNRESRSPSLLDKSTTSRNLGRTSLNLSFDKTARDGIKEEGKLTAYDQVVSKEQLK